MTSFPIDLTAAPAKFDPTSLTRAGASARDGGGPESLFQLHLRPASSSSSSHSSYDASDDSSAGSSTSTSTSPSSPSRDRTSAASPSDETAPSHHQERSKSESSDETTSHETEESGAPAPAEEATRDDEDQDSHTPDDEQTPEEEASVEAADGEQDAGKDDDPAVVVELSADVKVEPSPSDEQAQDERQETDANKQKRADGTKTKTDPADVAQRAATTIGKEKKSKQSEAASASPADEDGASTQPELAVEGAEPEQDDEGEDQPSGRRHPASQARSASGEEAPSSDEARAKTGHAGDKAAPEDAVVAESPQQPSDGEAPHRDRDSRAQAKQAKAAPNTATGPTPVQAETAPAEHVAVELTTDELSTRDSENSKPAAGAESNHEAAPTAQHATAGESAPAAAAGAGRLSQQLVSRARQSTGAGPQLTDADQTRFINRVARAFQSAQEGGGEIRLRLSPPQLGSLRLEVKIHSGVLSAHIEADTPTARSLLLDNLHVLRERLQEQNIRVEQFDVDLSDRQPGGLPDDTRDPHQQPSNPSRSSSSSVEGDAVGEGETPRAENPPRVGGDDQLNVIV